MSGKYDGLPVWEEGGVCMNESKALMRYLGTVHGYIPPTPVTQWEADVWMDFAGTIVPRL